MIDFYMRLLSFNNVYIRVKALKALSTISKVSAKNYICVELLEALANDSFVSVRESALEYLLIWSNDKEYFRKILPCFFSDDSLSVKKRVFKELENCEIFSNEDLYFFGSTLISHFDSTDSSFTVPPIYIYLFLGLVCEYSCQVHWNSCI